MNDSHKTRGHMATQPGIRGHSASDLFGKTGVVIFHRIGVTGLESYALFPGGAEARVLNVDVMKKRVGAS